MSMQTSLNVMSIRREAGGPIERSRILMYGATENVVLQATASAPNLVGVSDRHIRYSGSAPCNPEGIVEGQDVDCLVGGDVVVLFGANPPAYGEPVKPDAQGRATRAASGDIAIGTCESPAAEGFDGRVRIRIHEVS